MRGSIDVVIIGAGPYGLSVAAHLRSRGVDFRIFGEPMGAWKANMPPGMLLKSYPWASSLSDAEDKFTVKRFFGERGIPYSDSLMPLPLETFTSYGEAFQQRFAPGVERRSLVSLGTAASGLAAGFDDGETVYTRRIVIAVGLSAFKHLPAAADGLPAEAVSHAADYGPLGALDGKEVAIIGGGSSATDLAALLHERGISVTVVARGRRLKFAHLPRRRSLIERVVAPTSGIGNGWGMGVCAIAPHLVHLLPAELRAKLADSRAHGPLGGAFMTERVLGKVPLLLGRTIDEIKLGDSKVHLHLREADGKTDRLEVDHVICATGYRFDTARLGFLDPELAGRIRLTGAAPQLSRHYESSIPGVHFIGPAAARSFGPVCRFVYGARAPARHLARYLPLVLGRRAMPFIAGPAIDPAGVS